MTKRFMMLLFALVLATGLSFAQSTPSSSNAGQSASDSTTTTTTTTKTVHHSKKAASASSATSSEKLDINTANKEQLEALPGIGPKYSQKIIDGRPYRSKAELVSKHIVPRSVYDKIRADIIAHRGTTATASSKATTK